MAESQLILYGTSACHLCEEAEALLLALPLSQSIAVEFIDISEDDTLLARYGSRIPVLQRVVAEEHLELDWPFNRDQLLVFINASAGSQLPS